MKRKGLIVLLAGLVFLLTVACGLSSQTQAPDPQATEAAARSRATLQAGALPTSTWTPGPPLTLAPTPAPTVTQPEVPAPTLTPTQALTDTAASAEVPGPRPTSDQTSPAPGAPTQAPPPTATAAPSSTPIATTASAPPGTPTTEPSPTPTLTEAPPSATPYAGSRIAFSSNRDGNLEIYVVNPDGSGLIRLTDDPAEDSRPAWSPGGTRLAFESNRDGDFDIYVLNVADILQGTGDGNPTRITDSPGDDLYPTWSPDGARLAFLSSRDGNWEVYVIDVDGGSGATNLTNDPAEDFSPAWSPDGALGGERIAFDSDRNGNYEIYVMNVDGSGVVNLTNNAGGNVSPAWSPDGERLAFSSGRDGNWEIYVMNVADALQGSDGGDPTRLTDNPAADDQPTWSPDGERLAFISLRDGSPDIFSMNVAAALQGSDGRDVVNLTNNPAEEWDPNWSPR